jgi:hypothetical protein
MSGRNIDTLLDLWAASLIKHEDHPPFRDHNDLYATIDATPLGDVPWQSFSLTYDGEIPDNGAPVWMSDKYEVWYRDPRTVIRNMLDNPEFDGKFDRSPFRKFDTNGERQYQDFMSGDWAWKQAVSTSIMCLLPSNLFVKDVIAEDPATHDAMFVPIILGSDKTTVSVATGNNEYYPLYASIGNVHNSVRRAHQGALTLIGFLAIPKRQFSFEFSQIHIEYI